MHKENWCCQSRIIKDRNQGFLLFLKALFFLPEPGKSQDGLEYWSIHIDIHELILEVSNRGDISRAANNST
jgi:hypothetical protein